MIAWAIKDYFGGFRWGRIKEAYKGGGWWTPIFLMTVLPAATRFFETQKSTLAYVLVYGPILFCLFAAPLHSIMLPKLMYLCPMSRENRRKYIVASTVIRIGVPMLLGVLGAGILLARGICDWICEVGVLLNIISFSLMLGSGTNHNGFGKMSEEGQRVMNFDTRAGVWESFGLMLALLLGMAYPFVLAWDTPVPQWVKWLFLGFQLLAQLPITIKYMGFWKPSVEGAVYYENGYMEQRMK